MSFHAALEAATAADRAQLMGNPLFVDAMAGRVDRAQYLAFLREAFHHVRHTVPLMMACGTRLAGSHEWLRGKLVHYIEEEYGHEQWILADIRAAGGDAEDAARSAPALPTELMVAYAYDVVNRGNPVGFFGMVHVLEGTSTAIATLAADSIGRALGLSPKAFTYLRSHGAVDVEHVEFFRDVVNRLDREEDRAAVVHCSRMFFRLYGDIFRHLHQEHTPCISKIAASS